MLLIIIITILSFCCWSFLSLLYYFDTIITTSISILQMLFIKLCKDEIEHLKNGELIVKYYMGNYRLALTRGMSTP